MLQSPDLLLLQRRRLSPALLLSSVNFSGDRWDCCYRRCRRCRCLCLPRPRLDFGLVRGAWAVVDGFIWQRESHRVSKHQHQSGGRLCNLRSAHPAETGLPCDARQLVADYQDMLRRMHFLPTFIASSLLAQTTSPKSIRAQLESRWLLSHDSLQVQFGSTWPDNRKRPASLPTQEIRSGETTGRSPVPFGMLTS